MKKFVPIFMALFFVVSCQQAGTGVEASIRLTVGTVSLNGELAKIGDIVKAGDVIKTGEDAVCEVVFLEGNIVKVEPNTEMALNLTEESSSISLIEGRAGFALKNPPSETFEVETSTAIAAIRGTVFYVASENEDTAYFCTCNGSIDYVDDSGWSTNVTANHHTSLRLTYDENGEIEQLDSGMEYHDDTDMEKLAAAVDLVIDWSTPDGLAEE